MPPSRTELGKTLGLRNQSRVDQLRVGRHRKGWVRLLLSVERRIQLLREGTPILDPHELPAVAAGNPIVAEDYAESPRLHDFDSFAEQFESRSERFVHLDGDSLDRLGYRTGEILAVRWDPDPRNGELVVARIGNEVIPIDATPSTLSVRSSERGARAQTDNQYTALLGPPARRTQATMSISKHRPRDAAPQEDQNRNFFGS